MSINLNATVLAWKIDDFMSRDERKMLSNKFAIPGCPLVNWKVSCFPNGNTSQNRGCVSLFLTKLTKNCEVTLKFQLVVVGGDRDTDVVRTAENRFNDEVKDWGYAQFMEREHLFSHDRLVDATLTILVKVIDFGPVVYHDKHVNHRINWEPFNLATIRYCDVRLKTEDKTFEAHKFMLAKESPYFDRMFDSDFQEQINNEVDLTQFRAFVIEEILRFIYSGQLQDFDELSDKLIVAADYFQLNYLKILCQENMTFRMSAENCLQFLVIADQTNSSDLKKVAMRLVNENRMRINKSALKNLFKDNTDLGVELFCWNDSDDSDGSDDELSDESF